MSEDTFIILTTLIIIVVIAVLLISSANHSSQILEACAAISKSVEELRSCIEGM